MSLFIYLGENGGQIGPGPAEDYSTRTRRSDRLHGELRQRVILKSEKPIPRLFAAYTRISESAGTAAGESNRICFISHIENGRQIGTLLIAQPLAFGSG